MLKSSTQNLVLVHPESQPKNTLEVKAAQSHILFAQIKMVANMIKVVSGFMETLTGIYKFKGRDDSAIE